jgi:hypothetical protein
VLLLGECNLQTRVQESRLKAESIRLGVARHGELNAPKGLLAVLPEEANTSKGFGVT